MVKKKSKKGGLVSRIKDQAKKSGANKGKFLYFKPGTKVRIRFLEDMDDGKVVPFHDSYARGISVPCQTVFDRECPYCDDEELRHRELYSWCVYDYDSKEVKIIQGAANNASPIPALVGMYEAYGTLMDRDYVITREGSGTGTTYTVVPMDKVKFKNTKAKPYSESKFYELLDKAFPDEERVDDDDDDEENEKPAKKKKGKAKTCPECEELIEDCECERDDEDDDELEEDYEDLSAQELYKLCTKRGIKCKPKKKEDYYIALLEEQEDNAEDDEDDDEDW